MRDLVAIVAVWHALTAGIIAIELAQGDRAPVSGGAALVSHVAFVVVLVAAARRLSR